MSRRTRLLAGALISLSCGVSACAGAPDASDRPAAPPVADAPVERRDTETEVRRVALELCRLELALMDVGRAYSCEFYFDPDERPPSRREHVRVDAEAFDRLGTRIDELSSRVAPERRAAFERDVVEPYRRLRARVAPR